MRETLPHGYEMEMPLQMTTESSMHRRDPTTGFAPEEMGLDESEIKQETQEYKIKIEPPDEETDETYCHENWEEKPAYEETLINGFPIKAELEEAEIKFECVDLPDIDLSNRSDQNWQPLTGHPDRAGPPTKTFVNTASQTTDDSEEPKFTYIIKSEKHLKVLTGIPSFDILYKIVDMVKKVSPRLARAKGLKLTIADRVIMTYMKLKQAMSYDALSFFFKCSSKKSCERIFLTTLDTLSRGLQCNLCWVSQDIGSRNVVESFREHLNVRCVVNRIEIAIQRPKMPSHRTTTRSRYKRYHSVKFLTAVTPGGRICFLSKSNGGQISHRELFENSNIIEFLGSNDSLMILKDFPIDDICQKNGIKLVKSLFKDHKQEISNPQHYRNLLNINRTLRGFRIFRRKLSPTLTLKTEQIVTVLCALKNLSLL